MPLPTTKAGWVELLQSLGESVPASWNAAQIHAHWIDLQKGNKDMNGDSLEDKLKQLRKASRKKDNLKELLKTEEVEFNANMTIAQMMGVAEKQITMRFPATGTETLGYGSHGHRTYAEVIEKYPSYVTWAITTMEEADDPCWRLVRFATWAKQQKDKFQTKWHKTTSPAKTESSAGSFAVVEPDAMKERAEIEQMKAVLTQKMREMEAKELMLNQKEAELELPHGAPKTRREM